MADTAVLQIGDDLVIKMVQIADLREQETNAQIMQPRQLDRLTANIQERGAVESIPYVHQPGGKGPMSIVSGHHRVRAARGAGLKAIPAIVEERPMRRSQIVAKQIAHNELVGSSDEQILRRLIAEIDDATDLLTTGLDEAMLPTVDAEIPTLMNPSVDFDWRIVSFTFLPQQTAELRMLVDLLDPQTEMVGVADRNQFKAFSEAVGQYGRAHDIRSVSTTVAVLTKLALQELADARPAE